MPDLPWHGHRADPTPMGRTSLNEDVGALMAMLDDVGMGLLSGT